MATRYKKRKNRPYEVHEPQQSAPPDASLFIQAHEADLVRGPQAWSAASSLEVAQNAAGQTVAGDGLIQWSRGQTILDMDEDDHMELGSAGLRVDRPTQPDTHAVWVDRYDARLLLESLPDPPLPSTTQASDPGSPGGWSDLPSDTEDTFFFSVSEAEDYRRDKRRRVISRDREARLAALRDEDGDQEEADPREGWGGSDEEPDEPQRELIRRTAAHILGSPNPAQLEMRILANHGADPRFAFLRGRWGRAWRLAKGKFRLEQEAEKRRKEDAAKPVAMGGLAGYGSDSDEDEEDEEEEEAEGAGSEVGGDTENTKDLSSRVDVEDPPPPPPNVISEDDEVAKAARRARAKEWAEKRRAEKEAGAQKDG